MNESIKTLPLATADIIGFFENPDHFFYVDYNNSTLKRESFLTYIANMKMKCDIINYTEICYEDRRELLFTFFGFAYVIDIPVLRNALASVLLYSRSKEVSYDYFSAEEMDAFITQHKEFIDTISSFFDSMLFVMPSMSNEFREQVFVPAIESGEIETIEDPGIIGINVFGLIGYPNFVDMFIGLSSDIPVIKYYKYSIENYLYKNKKFYQIIAELETPSFLMSVFNLFSSSEDKETQYFEDMKKGA